MNSFNHYAYGAIGEWMYRAMAGLEVDEDQPGFKHAVYAPRIGGNLKFVDAGYHSVYGEHGLRWEVHDREVNLSFKVPENTTASVILENAENVLEADGLIFERGENASTAEAGSGEYTVRYLLK